MRRGMNKRWRKSLFSVQLNNEHNIAAKGAQQLWDTKIGYCCAAVYVAEYTNIEWYIEIKPQYLTYSLFSIQITQRQSLMRDRKRNCHILNRLKVFPIRCISLPLSFILIANRKLSSSGQLSLEMNPTFQEFSSSDQFRFLQFNAIFESSEIV